MPRWARQRLNANQSFELALQIAECLKRHRDTDAANGAGKAAAQ